MENDAEEQWHSPCTTNISISTTVSTHTHGLFCPATTSVYCSLDIFLHELPVKVRPQRVVDEASLFLVDVAASTVLEDYIVVPPGHTDTM